MMSSAIFRVPLLRVLPLLIVVLTSCSKKRVFESDCNNGASYKQVDYTELVNHIDKYNKQYIEVTGKYIEGFEQSALVNDSLFASHDLNKSLWVDFSQDCPLYLRGTTTGLFTYNNGQFTQMNDRHVTIRGMINTHDKGHLKQYKGSIERISYIEL